MMLFYGVGVVAIGVLAWFVMREIKASKCISCPNAGSCEKGKV